MMKAFRIACVVVVLTSAAFSQSLDNLAGTVVLLYERQQVPALKDGKPIIEHGNAVMETRIDYGTGFFASPDGATMMLVTAEHVSSAIGPDFRATLLGV